ncbi:MAG: hypothetical protein JEY96_16695 [Bacteroidales bacterium]|nr:hypothetical protein [Bacteroidales bacterium]
MKKLKMNFKLDSIYLKLFILINFIYYLYVKLIPTEWIKKNVVLEIFHKLLPNLKDEILLITFLIIILISLSYKSIKYKTKPSLFTTFLNLIFFTIYFMERVRLYNEFELYKLSFINIAIFDLIILSFLMLLIFKWNLYFIASNLKVEKSEYLPFVKDSIYLNNSNSELKVDIFNRTDFVKKIAKKLIGIQASGSFNLGIQGSWGSGKTYMLNALLKELDGKVISIEYNPWKSFEDKNIVKTFFDTLSQSLKLYDEEIIHNINQYSSYLLDSLDISVWNISLKKKVELGKLYENINTRIGKLKKPVAIFIDDLDRLDRNEIMDIFKLIRNTASFSNIIFITAFDLTYLEDTVFKSNGNQMYNSEKSDYNYLEKIFQVVFTLPIVDNFTMHFELKQSLLKGSTIIKQKYSEDVEKVINYSEKLIFRCIKNYRDIIRFSNQFCLDVEFIDSEVDFGDFFLFELLKYKSPKIIDEIYFNKKVLTRSNQSDSFKLNIQELEANFPELYIEILGHLFNHQNPTSINNVNNFYKYFSLSIFTHDIGFEEFKQRVFDSNENIIELIDSWISRNVKIDQIIYKYKSFIDSTYFEFDEKEKILNTFIRFLSGYKYMIISILKTDDYYEQIRYFAESLYIQANKLIITKEFQRVFLDGYFKAPKTIYDFYVFHFLKVDKRNNSERFSWLEEKSIKKKLEELYINYVIPHPKLELFILLVNYRCLNTNSSYMKQSTIKRIFDFENVKYLVENTKDFDYKVENYCIERRLDYISSEETLREIFKIMDIVSGITDRDYMELSKLIREFHYREIKMELAFRILFSNFNAIFIESNKDEEKFWDVINTKVLDPVNDRFYGEFISYIKNSTLIKTKD